MYVMYRLVGEAFVKQKAPYRTYILFLSGRSIRDEGWASISFFFRLSPTVVFFSRWISTYVLSGLLDWPIVLLDWPFKLYWPWPILLDNRNTDDWAGFDIFSFASCLFIPTKKKTGRSQTFFPLTVWFSMGASPPSPLNNYPVAPGR